jgi:hypothetical protein
MKSLNLGPAERARALREVASYESYANFITTCIDKSTSSKQSTRLQTLQLLARPIGAFIYTFEALLLPEEVDMSLIWALISLNVNVSPREIHLLSNYYTDQRHSSPCALKKSCVA